MSLMARLNDFLERHPGRLPFFTATPKTGNRLSTVFALNLLRRNHMRHDPAMAGNDDSLSALDLSKQFGKTGLCLCRLNCIHYLSGYYDWLFIVAWHLHLDATMPPSQHLADSTVFDSTCPFPEVFLSTHITAVGDENFGSEVLSGDDPVLVDFWAEWCGPCKMVAPILDELAEQYQGRLKMAKLNVDENTQTPPKYGIRGIPTLILFKNGEIAGQRVGALSKSQLTAFIEEHL